MVAALIALAAFISSAAAQAQIVFDNTSGCDLLLTLTAPGATSGQHLLSANSSGTITVPAGFVPNGVEDFDGRRRLFIAGCTGCIPVPAQGSPTPCCVNVCYDGSANKITISACSPCQ